MKLKYSCVFLMGMAALQACTTEQPEVYLQDEIIEVLEKQQDYWNHGDLAGFMSYYDNSDDLCFLSASGLIKGHDRLAERYEIAYPDAESMGKLVFEVVEIIRVGDNNAYVIGEWILHRETDKPGGFFSLLFEKQPSGWKIIADHTS